MEFFFSTVEIGDINRREREVKIEEKPQTFYFCLTLKTNIYKSNKTTNQVIFFKGYSPN